MINVDEGIKALKNELRNYKYYVKKRNNLSEELDNMWYKLAGVKAADASKIPTRSYNPEFAEEMRLEFLEKIDVKQKEFDRVDSQVKHIEKILDMVEEEIRGPLENIYINRKTYFATSVKFGIDMSYLQYRMDKNLADIIKKGDI